MKTKLPFSSSSLPWVEMDHEKSFLIPPAGLRIENSPAGGLIIKPARGVKALFTNKSIFSFMVMSIFFCIALIFFVAAYNERSIIVCIIGLCIKYIIAASVINTSVICLNQNSVSLESSPLPLFSGKKFSLQNLTHFRVQILEDQSIPIERVVNHGFSRYEEISEEVWRKRNSNRRQMFYLICVYEFWEKPFVNQLLFPEKEHLFFIRDYLNHYYFGCAK